MRTEALRFHTTTKKDLKRAAKKRRITESEFIRELILQKLYGK
jgi:hypothetical protein